jgi:hypothetical protein
MSVSDSWGNYETPCPTCQGVVEYWFFDADCRGNDSSGGIACKSCKRHFEVDEWEKIAAPEIAEMDRKYWQSQYKCFGPYKFSPYHPDYDFSVAKPRHARA